LEGLFLCITNIRWWIVKWGKIQDGGNEKNYEDYKRNVWNLIFETTYMKWYWKAIQNHEAQGLLGIFAILDCMHYC